MIELLLVVAAIVVLGGLSFLVLTVPPLALAWGCLAMLALGFGLGLPAGLYYHLLLRRELLAQGDLPRRWYMNPFSHHERLDEPALARLRPWWTAGGLGFLLIMLAMALAVIVLVTRR